MIEQWKTRGVRGAITVEANTPEEIQKGTLEMLNLIFEKNSIDLDDITTAIFTVTDDLNAEFPAKIARIHLGWDDIQMICAKELSVPGSIELCVRVLIIFNTTLPKKEIKHVYLGKAQNLRPDLI